MQQLLPPPSREEQCYKKIRTFKFTPFPLQAQLQREAASHAAAAKSAATPMDMENLMQQNKDKLNMLKVGDVCDNGCGAEIIRTQHMVSRLCDYQAWTGHVMSMISH